LREDALRREGVGDAAAKSRRAVGNVALAQDDVRDVWVWPWVDGLVRDIRFTQRSLRRQPAFALTCIATIAIGTGALTSVLSVVHVVLLGAAPYPNHERLVQNRPGRQGRRRRRGLHHPTCARAA
jgi:hypothetical protein